MLEQAPRRTCGATERGAHAEETVAGLVTPVWYHEVPTMEQSVPERLNSMEGTHVGAVQEELQPM